MTRRVPNFPHAVFLGLLLVAFLAVGLKPASPPRQTGVGSFIVRYSPEVSETIESRVAELGGSIRLRLPIISGMTVSLAKARVGELMRTGGVISITTNSKVQLLHEVDGFNGSTYPSSMYNLNQSIRTKSQWTNNITGAGIDVALIDSGVVGVNGLSYPGKVINGPDLSFESQAANLRYLDTFGHGTHMAGIIAGRDDQAASLVDDHDDFIGVAPGARIVSVKVADAEGSTDISQVIAAINWVVEHRTSGRLNIRVLNLSFGTDSVQDYALDPLTYATEVAWRKGIVVVVAAGNSAFGSSRLNNPAYDPHVIAVGADDTKGTTSILDDTVPAWTARGDGRRNPDVLAPGVSVAALRNPGSYIDEMYPGGRISPRFFKGSGTSQAAAFVSGAAALLLQQRPFLTPNQVKAILTSTATPIPTVPSEIQGAGLINMRQARDAAVPVDPPPTVPYSTGHGELEGARGSAHVSTDGYTLVGERDIHGVVWDADDWSVGSLAGVTWSGGTYRGTAWTGQGWSGDSWEGAAWTGNTWTGRSWSSYTWTGNTWTGNTWTGNTWTGNTWTGNTWTGNTWTGGSWTGECTMTSCSLGATYFWPTLWGI